MFDHGALKAALIKMGQDDDDVPSKMVVKKPKIKKDSEDMDYEDLLLMLKSKGKNIESAEDEDEKSESSEKPDYD